MTIHEADSDLKSHERDLGDTGSIQPAAEKPLLVPGSAAFQAKYAGRDIAAG